MTFAGFQLRELEVDGEGLEPAILQFRPGLNVLSGSSDTGKSYIVDCLDYMLG
jgi:DNA repair ATPase RecN